MYGYYEIEKGDTLTSIAQKFQTTVEEIARINKLEPLFVAKAGEYLLVPISEPSLFNYHRVNKGETLYQIAKKYNTDLNNLAKLNGLDLDDYIYEGDLLVVPKENTSIYITKAGDTLKNVAQSLNVLESDLAEQNPTIYLLEDQLLVYRNK